MQTPWQIVKPILSVRPNERAIFGMACRDMRLLLQEDSAAKAEVGSGAGSTKRALEYRSFSQLAPADLPLLIERIKRLMHKLEFRFSRRYRSVRRSTRLDIQRSVSRSFRHGGVLFRLGFRQHRRREPHMMILCDVSASMVRHARFTLPLLFGLSRGAASTEAFLCAGELEPVTEYFRAETDFQKATDWLLSESAQVGRGTCLSHAFEALSAKKEGSLNSSTCLLIVSDAETTEPAETVAALKKLSKRAKQVIWLNTEPRSQWKQNRIIPQLRKYCRMEECTSLAGTVRILQRI